MAIFVDESRWWFKDHQWCHMVSNHSFEELHLFAVTLEIPPRAFHGDHYDLPMHIRAIAIDLGAQVVTSRELVTHLVNSGLRMSAAQRRAYKNADALRQYRRADDRLVQKENQYRSGLKRPQDAYPWSRW